MNLFQVLSVLALGTLLLRELTLMIRRRGPQRPRWFRSVVWLAAMVAIIYPDLTTLVAQRLGIGHGAIWWYLGVPATPRIGVLRLLLLPAVAEPGDLVGQNAGDPPGEAGSRHPGNGRSTDGRTEGMNPVSLRERAGTRRACPGIPISCCTSMG